MCPIQTKLIDRELMSATEVIICHFNCWRVRRFNPIVKFFIEITLERVSQDCLRYTGSIAVECRRHLYHCMVEEGNRTHLNMAWNWRDAQKKYFCNLKFSLISWEKIFWFLDKCVLIASNRYLRSRNLNRTSISSKNDFVREMSSPSISILISSTIHYAPLKIRICWRYFSTNTIQIDWIRWFVG